MFAESDITRFIKAGATIAKDVRPKTGRTYSCSPVCARFSLSGPWPWNFVEGEIEVLAANRMVLRVFPNRELGVDKMRTMFFESVTLDHERDISIVLAHGVEGQMSMQTTPSAPTSTDVPTEAAISQKTYANPFSRPTPSALLTSPQPTSLSANDKDPVASVSSQPKGIRLISVKDSTGKSMDLYERSYALLVGVSKYTDGWPSLPSIPDEMDLVEAVLQTNGFRTLKVMNPNSAQLKKAFEDFIAEYGYKKNNRLLFYFSGHGWSRKGGEHGYLVPTDAPDPRQNEEEFLRRSLNMTRILAWCKEMEAKHAMFLFDSCFSGTIFKTKALPETPPHITSLTARPVRQFITAGEAGEQVPAKSVFVTCVLRGLSGEADLSKDGYITGTELGMYLHDKVIYYKTGQTPQYGKMRDPELDEGDFVFEVNPEGIPPSRNHNTQEESVAGVEARKAASASPSNVAASSEPEDSLGIKVAELTVEHARQLGYETGEGVLVIGVDKDGKLSRSGIQPDSLILSVNRRVVHNVKEFREALDKATGRKTLLLLVRSGQNLRYVAVAEK